MHACMPHTQHAHTLCPLPALLPAAPIHIPVTEWRTLTYSFWLFPFLFVQQHLQALLCLTHHLLFNLPLRPNLPYHILPACMPLSFGSLLLPFLWCVLVRVCLLLCFPILNLIDDLRLLSLSTLSFPNCSYFVPFILLPCFCYAYISPAPGIHTCFGDSFCWTLTLSTCA